MEWMTGFIGGVVSSLVASVVGHLALKRLRTRRLRNEFREAALLWRPFFDSETLAVLTARRGPLPRSTPKVSFREVEAMRRLSELFSTHGSAIGVTDSEEVQLETLHSRNLILLGSQKENQATQHVRGLLPMRIGYDVEGNLTFGDHTYPTIPSDGTQIMVDHALVVRCPNPFGSGGKLLLIAGNHGAATAAAANFLTSPSGIAKVGARLGGSDFVAVVKVKMVGSAAVTEELVKCWTFEDVVHHEGARDGQ